MDYVTALLMRLRVAEAIITRAEECVREEYAREEILKVLRNPLPKVPDRSSDVSSTGGDRG